MYVSVCVCVCACMHACVYDIHMYYSVFVYAYVHYIYCERAHMLHCAVEDSIGPIHNHRRQLLDYT